MNNLPAFYPKKKSPARGFTAKFPHPRSRSQDFAEEIAHWTKRQTLNAMAVINGVVYSVAAQANAITKEAEGGWQINHPKVNKLVHSGCSFLKTSVEGLRTYIRRYWKIASSNGNAVRAVRDALTRLRLIKPANTKQGSWAWSVYMDVDFAGLLYLYEMLESALLNYWEFPFEELPKHKGALVKDLYNAAKGFMNKIYRRVLPEGAVGRDVYGDPIYKNESAASQEQEAESPSPIVISPVDSAPYLLSETELWHNPTLPYLTRSATNLSTNTGASAARISTAETSPPVAL